MARHELTVNYRTPAEVMELAARLLERVRAAPAPGPLRQDRGGRSSRRVHTGGRPLGAADIAGAVADAPPRGRDRAGRGGHSRATGRRRPSGGAEHLTAVDAKGLEFDGVVVVDPEAIVRESPGATGMARLYVALTRATTRLTILAPTPPGPPLDDVLGPFEPIS